MSGAVVACVGAGCSVGGRSADEGQALAERVDLERFMGKWHVQGCTPTFLDRGVTQATETYELTEDGKIRTTYRFRKGSGGRFKTLHPVGWVHDKSTNAEWRMRFFGLFTAPYLILHVDEDYEETVIGHPGKEMAWIMSRSPEMDDATYERLYGELKERGYSLSRFKRLAHKGDTGSSE